MLTMVDGINAAALPPWTTLAAGYLNTRTPGWRSYGPIKARFPNATVESITVSYGTAARIIDCETEDATPSDAARQVAEDLSDTIYTDSSQWPAVEAAVTALGLAVPFYWVAAYLAPGSPPPKSIPAAWAARGCIAWQWQDFGGWDQSLVDPRWLETKRKAQPTMQLPIASSPSDEPLTVYSDPTVANQVAVTFADWVGTEPSALLRAIVHKADGSNALEPATVLVGNPGLGQTPLPGLPTDESTFTLSSYVPVLVQVPVGFDMVALRSQGDATVPGAALYAEKL
jgi:hypothetical protein